MRRYASKCLCFSVYQHCYELKREPRLFCAHSGNSLCSPTIADLFMHQTAQCCCTGLIGPVSSCGVQVLPKKFWHFPRLGKHNAKTGRAEEAMTH